MPTPSERHRAWAEIFRTGCAFVAAGGTAYLVGNRIGWW